MVKKIISFILFFLISINFVNATEVDVISEKYILYNMNEGVILDEKDAYSETYIASLTKIMSVIVALENIDDYEKKVTITSDMLKDIDWDVAVTGFSINQEVTYNDLLYGAILSSGADSINALGYSIAGNMDEFVKLMNNKVKELGLKNTKFANAIGLYDENNYSSAYDVAQILIYSLKNKKFKEIFETKEYKLSSGKDIKSTLYYYNKNSDINVEYIKGAKTGYINASGYCLASTATINNVDYLLVTLNARGSTQNNHILDSTKIYDYFSSNYSYQNIVSRDDIVVNLNTKYAKEKNINIKSGVNIDKYLKNGFDKTKLKYEYNGISKIDATTKIGTKIGTIKVIYNDEVLDEFDLLFNEKLTLSVLGIMYKNNFLIIACILLIILFSLPSKKKRKRK
ncbi:MAG: hypothetical protein PUA90_05145 [bacterium]|nr:hypothetical protein [bacterium]